MPARSRAQQRFFGLVRAVQKGTVPMNSVDEKVRRAAGKIDPKDVREFAATKHTKLPEVKDGEIIKMSSLDRLAVMDMLTKVAGIETKVRSVEKSMRAMAQARRSSLSEFNKKLRKDNENMRKQVEQAKQQVQQMQAEAQSAIAGAQAPGPTPPPAQVPYGQMLVQQQMAAQEAQK